MAALTLRPLLSLLLLALLALAAAAQAGNMAGGWSAAPLDEERVRQAAEFAFRNTFLQNKSADTSRISWSLARAQQQVVAGMNYAISLNVMIGEECQVRPFLLQLRLFWFWSGKSLRRVLVCAMRRATTLRCTTASATAASPRTSCSPASTNFLLPLSSHIPPIQIDVAVPAGAPSLLSIFSPLAPQADDCTQNGRSSSERRTL